MKEFDLQDVFLMSKIIDKMELRVEADKLAKTIKTDKLEDMQDAKELGRDVIAAIGIEMSAKFLSNLHRADKEIMQLIANLTEKQYEAVKKMKLKDIKQFFIDLATSEGFEDFFELAETSKE